MRASMCLLLALGCSEPSVELPPAAPAAAGETPADDLAGDERRFLEDLARQLVRGRNSRPRPETTERLDHTLRLVAGGPGTGRPGVALEAWVFEAWDEVRGGRAPNAADTVLLLHGLGDSKASMAGLARRLQSRGMRAVAVDLRGHGRSEGDHIGYGAFEAPDLSQLLDALEAEGRGPGRVGVYAASYGAHVAAQLAARDPRVHRVVAVGAYASLRSTVPEFVRLRYPERADLPEPAIQRAVTAAATLAGFDAEAASAERWLSAPEAGPARVLFIHGADDEVVPIAHAERLASACGAPCRLLRLEGKDHLGSMHGPELRAALLAWLEGRWDDVPGGPSSG
ncbi:MAG: alpha/beta fold hydrolase [Myxococcota bacterium]